MSRIGKKPIPILDGVQVKVEGRKVHVEGPKGKLEWEHRPEIFVELSDDGKDVVVKRSGDDRTSRAFHGLTRSLIKNPANCSV